MNINKEFFDRAKEGVKRARYWYDKDDCLTMAAEISKIMSESFNGEFSIENREDGTVRYKWYDEINDEEKVLDDIEKRGLVILDENEEERWIDAIDPRRMESNVVEDDSMSKITKTIADEIDEKFLDAVRTVINENKTKL